MAIHGTLTTACKLMLLQAIAVDTFKVALYTSAATLDDNTAAYTAADEIEAVGYEAGGIELHIADGYPISDPVSGQAWLRFEDAVWPAITTTCRGALIYNATRGNKAVRVIDFGVDQHPENGQLTIRFPVSQSPTIIVA